MSTKVAINGFGRIGRLFLRAVAKQQAGPGSGSWRINGQDGRVGHDG